MTAVCCSGRCMGCCRCCTSRSARARWARCTAALAVLCVLLGAGFVAAWAGAWSAWTLPGAALAGVLLQPLGHRPVLALTLPLQVAVLLLVAEGPGALRNATDSADPPDLASNSSFGGSGMRDAFSFNASDTNQDPVQDADDSNQDDGFLLGVRLARSAFAGAALGLALPTALFYLAEVWRPKSRGAVLTVPAAALVSGRTLAYGLEAPLGSRLTALVGLGPPCLALLLLYAAPPSPHWLALKGRLLPRGRGRREEDDDEEEGDAVREQQSSVCAGNWRGPLMALVLVGTLPLAGLALLEKHLPDNTWVSAPGWIGCSSWRTRMGFGGAALLAVLVVALLVDRCGRRPLLASACLCLAAAHATLGYFRWYMGFPLVDRAPQLAWIIVAGAVALGALAASTLVTTAWIVLAESLPSRAKSLMPGLALLLDAVLQCGLDASWLALSVLDEALPQALREGRWCAAWLWAHALWCLVLALIVAVVLPEARGLGLARLHQVLRGRYRRNRQTRL